jgi:large subunit ribosomal protein L4
MEEKVKKVKTQEVKLNPKIWKVPFNGDLVAQVLYVFQSNERKGTSSVKGRGEVSGGGRKPWKQKGTGRARHGSIRSPLWVGGGVAFGPNNRNWSRSINKGMVRKAMCIVLSERNKNNSVKILNTDSKQELKAIRDKVLKDVSSRTLLISDNQQIRLALRNNKDVSVHTPMRVNVKHVVSCKQILIDKEAINILENRLTHGK